ncbi:MAG: hypothetical protein PW789_10735 [Edaphobacter sp.]|uniref:hypothetical protein n=1 Tax=Edaphobacter sp. TaxID=1934404 RepID=UPI00239A0D1D|nr:hypothetical protein [Edaphobacter sp.]MDE1177065.1 hypothetical protein [Edaphobacter sp.]
MMVRAWVLSVLILAASAAAQTAPPPAPPPQETPAPAAQESTPIAPLAPLKPRITPSDSPQEQLPDAPSASLQEDAVLVARRSQHASGKDQEPCNFISALGMIYFDPKKVDAPRPRCSELVYPYQRFLSTNIAIPLTWQEKGYLAAHYTTDPSSLGTIVGISAINIAIDSHTAYGPGFAGFGKLAGISVLQNATAEFFGTFAVPAIAHQDPRYYRRPDKPFGKRILYSVSRTFVSRSDDGHAIPNYGTLAAYPIVAELSNLYVPGIQSDGASTAERILTGYALDPVNNLVNEFLPDLASHVHVRIIFVQQILNNIAYTNPGSM